jgi:signal transduction histidine kinase
LLLPVNWAWRLASGGEINEMRMLIFGIDMLVALLALVSIAMIRRGRFRPAIVLFLAMQLISLEITFAIAGVLSQVIDPAPTILTLVISGLVLGRRALWIAFGLLMLVFATGFAAEMQQAAAHGVPVIVSLVNVPAVVISYGVITIILDRSVQALRESLAESNARGLELQREMAQREHAQAQLLHAQKLEATGRLASGIAHDFNNILQVILGFAAKRDQILDIAGGQARADAVENALSGIEAAGLRGSELVRKLLDFSRHDHARVRTFDAAQAIAGMQPMLRQLFPREVELALPDATSPVFVQMDRGEFELMILNVAANARDAMPDGGRFSIRLSPHPEGGVAIALSDTGHGMDEAVRQRIFEPFFSMKSATGGTGLGLSVIHDMILASGGTIDVTSAPGEGSTFHVRVPDPTTP